MAYRRFKLPENGFGSATFANVATLRPETARTVARLATVAGQTAENDDSADWQAYFDERAGIREFDGEMPRDEAEALALQDTIAALGPRPTNGGKWPSSGR
jgi:hypothetical protein